MLLSQLVEEIERIETTKNQFGKVMERIKDTINLAKFPAKIQSILLSFQQSHLVSLNLILQKRLNLLVYPV